MAKTVCIICGLEKPGIPVKEDYVIGSIRWLKKNVFRNEKGNKLVVCRECYPKYKKEREAFISRQRTYIALGIIFLIASVLLSASKLGAIFLGILVLLLLYLVSLLNYVPDLDIEKAQRE